MTVTIVNSANVPVASYATTASSGTWSVAVTAAQAQALADGSDNIAANVSDLAGNPATQATVTIKVDETAPMIAISTNDSC